MSELVVRVAQVADAAEILAIYAPYIEKTTITFEYTVPSLEEFTQRIAQTLPRYPYLVAEKEGKILGYAYAGAYKQRAAYDWSVETTVYVAESCPVKGVGTQLYQALENILQKQHVLQLLACITAGNQKSVSFHQKLGYQMIGTFPKIGFKFGQWCDISWMQKTLGTIPDEPKSFIPFSKLSY